MLSGEARCLCPVVQSIFSLTSSLTGQLVKYFMTLLLNTLIFFLKKAFALEKLLTFFQKKILEQFRYQGLKFKKNVN